MEQILNFIRNLGPIKIGIIGAVTLLVFIVLLILSFGVQNTHKMVVLYTQLDPSITSKIAAQLTIESIPYHIENHGSEILVPQEKVNKLRITFAQNGLSGHLIGYEIFDNENAYNSSSFLQRINELRALEGELTRTILSINGILNARVHIVMPRRELFSRTTQKATASVLIRMEGNQRLSSDQITGIRNLIANAVPNLNPSNISIVDQHGVLLARGSDDETLEQTRALRFKLRIEDSLQDKLMELLSQTFGENNVRVEVEADIDMTKTIINDEKYDPNGQVLRSSEEINDHNTSRSEGPQPVTVSNNLPNAPAELPQKNSGIINESTHNETRNNYDISKTLTSSTLQTGQIKRLSVAVLINNQKLTNDKKNKKPARAPLTQVEINNVTRLVKSAIGFNDRRGDQVTVINMPFTQENLGFPKEDTYFGIPVSDLRWMIKIFILTILAILVLLLFIRPIIKKYTAVEESQLQLDEFGNIIPSTTTTESTTENEQYSGDTMSDQGIIDEELEQMINVKNIEGRIKASSLQKILEIIDQHPQEVINIIRGWLYEEDQ